MKRNISTQVQLSVLVFPLAETPRTECSHKNFSSR
jgi:hypothetical protein